MKNLIILALIISLFTSCTKKIGYECTCYNVSGVAKGKVQFFDKETHNDPGKPEQWAVSSCNKDVLPVNKDTSTYATCERKRMEYGR